MNKLSITEARYFNAVNRIFALTFQTKGGIISGITKECQVSNNLPMALVEIGVIETVPGEGRGFGRQKFYSWVGEMPSVELALNAKSKTKQITDLANAPKIEAAIIATEVPEIEPQQDDLNFLGKFTIEEIAEKVADQVIAKLIRANIEKIAVNA